MFWANRTVWASGLATVMGVALLLSAGCGGGAGDYEGPERAAVTGKVTLDGNNVVHGSITFVGTRRASGGIKDGAYSIPEAQGPNLGKNKVQIIGYEKGPQAPASEEEEEGGQEERVNEDGSVVEGEDFGEQIIPANYNAATELSVEITSGPNTHNFELKSSP